MRRHAARRAFPKAQVATHGRHTIWCCVWCARSERRALARTDPSARARDQRGFRLLRCPAVAIMHQAGNRGHTRVLAGRGWARELISDAGYDRARAQTTYEKVMSEVPKYKMITPSILSDRLRVRSQPSPAPPPSPRL
jgi:hypothetical protein